MPNCCTCGERFGSKKTFRRQCDNCRSEGINDVLATAHQRFVISHNRSHPNNRIPIPQPGDKDRKRREVQQKAPDVRTELSNVETDNRIINGITISEAIGHHMESPSTVSNGSKTCYCHDCGRGIVVNPWYVTDGVLGKLLGSALTERCLGRGLDLLGQATQPLAEGTGFTDPFTRIIT